MIYQCILKLKIVLLEGGIVSDTAGGSFTPHVVNVNTGEVTTLFL